MDSLAEILVAQQDFIGQLKEQKEETVKNMKKVKTTYDQVVVENQPSVQNASEMINAQKNNKNSKNSLPLPESEMMLALQLETNTRLTKEAPSQTITTMPDEIGKVKEHVTGDMEIDEFDDTQLGLEKETVTDSKEGQMSYKEINQEIKEVSKMSQLGLDVQIKGDESDIELKENIEAL
ncbi:17780_t:CDS:2 [Gigaspora margarita]|uniref:17780_t:CDS:1 n=1 Tax=Gigaspora margarita TaxID=4874 RepID=A0ABN7UNZ0_GIGMA|nr:17780_t:CDS:2 [Gigaspora margarita]